MDKEDIISVLAEIDARARFVYDAYGEVVLVGSTALINLLFGEKTPSSGVCCASPEDFAVLYRENDKFGKAAAAWRSANSRAQRERAIVERISVCMNEKLENSEIEISEASRYLGMLFADLSDFLEGDVRRFAYAKAIEMHDDLDAFIASRDDRPETSPAND